MKVLLTGASGLLGAHLLQQLLHKGWQVRVITRDIPSRSYLKTVQDQVEVIQGDLLTTEWPDDLMQGIDAVIHAAAFVSPRPEDEERMHQINNLASQRFFKLAQKMQIPYWVQISTTAVLTGLALPSDIVSESNFGKLRPTAYARSKFAFDKFLASQNDSSMRILKIYPGYMLGAWDSTPSSGAVFLQMRWNKIKGYLEGSKNFVAASDVAKGILRALEKNAQGDFILGGFNLQISDFLGRVKHALALDSWELQALTDAEFTALPLEEKSGIQEFCASAAVTSQKAQAAFKYDPQVSVDQMIQDTIDSFVEMRLLKKPK